jgi:GWxTD domain-containing protein
MSIRPFTLLLALAATGHAGQFATPGRGDVRFSIDTALFRCGSGTDLMLEVYQEVPLGNLSRNEAGMSSFTTVVVLTGTSGDTLAADAWRSEIEWASERSALNAVILPVTPGEHVLTVTVTDELNGLLGSAERVLSVEVPGHFSELELARTLMPAVEGSENTLKKGGLIVFPAASNTFSVPAETRVYTYQELYDLDGQTLHRQTGISGPDGAVVFARPGESFVIPQGMSSVSLVDSLDLQPARTSGLYTLFILYTGESGDTLAFTTKPMLIDVATVPLMMDQPPEVTEIPARLNEFSLLLTGAQADLYGRLDEAGRAAYFQQYWQGSPDERAAFEARCRTADRFMHMEVEGWRTDRGRVLVRYGEPEDIERSPFTTTHVPYEVWSYYEGTTMSFVFADLNSSGDFRQVYSTVPGEVSFQNWQNMIQTMQTMDGSTEGSDNDW